MIAKPALKTVLCVDDHPQICNLVEAILTEHRILSASSVDEAMSLLSDGVFMIVMDCNLIKDAAAETLTAIKSVRPEVKIVLTSAGDHLAELKPVSGMVDGMIMKTGGDFVASLRRVVDELEE